MADGIVVLDAWPVVEHYRGSEPAASAVAQLLERSGEHPVMSVVNFTEVCSALAVRIGPEAAHRAARHLSRLVTLEEATSAVAEIASRLKYAYRMALGDTYAVATAISLDAPVWTGDAEILCDDRVWQVHDLRSEADRRRHEQRQAQGTLEAGRREVLTHLDHRELLAYVAAPIQETASVTREAFGAP